VSSKGLCPYCGSNNVSLNVEITVTCSVNENGEITVDGRWEDIDEIHDTVIEASDEKMTGYCHDCHKHLSVINECCDSRVSFKESEN